MGNVVWVPFGQGPDSNGARTQPEIDSMGRHPSAVSVSQGASRTPEGGSYLGTVNRDPTGAEAAELGVSMAKRYLSPGGVTRALDGLFFPPSLFRDKKEENPYPSRRVGTLGALLIGAALTFNTGGSRDFIYETVTTVADRFKESFQEQPPVLTGDNYCLQRRVGLRSDEYYPPSLGGPGRDANGC